MKTGNERGDEAIIEIMEYYDGSFEDVSQQDSEEDATKNCTVSTMMDSSLALCNKMKDTDAATLDSCTSEDEVSSLLFRNEMNATDFEFTSISRRGKTMMQFTADYAGVPIITLGDREARR